MHDTAIIGVPLANPGYIFDFKLGIPIPSVYFLLIRNVNGVILESFSFILSVVHKQIIVLWARTILFYVYRVYARNWQQKLKYANTTM